MAAVSRPLNGRMAETGPIKTGAQKEERKALAKIAALGALLTRQAGAFLALSCPTDEAAREAAIRREKLLLIPSTSAANKCLTGPPSTTLMHAWEKVEGELKQIKHWFQGLSRKCGSTTSAEQERTKIEQSVPGLKDVLELSTYVMRQYNNHKKEQEAVWREQRANHLLMYDAKLCFVPGVAVVDPRTLQNAYVARRVRLHWTRRDTGPGKHRTAAAPTQSWPRAERTTVCTGCSRLRWANNSWLLRDPRHPDVVHADARARAPRSRTVTHVHVSACALHADQVHEGKAAKS